MVVFMEKIYDVTIGVFEQIERHDFGYRFIEDENSLEQLVCIRDGNDMIDIVNCQRYHLLKRDSKGFISKEELNNINVNEQYAIHSKLYTNKNAKTLLKKQLQAFKTRILINKHQKQLTK